MSEAAPQPLDNMGQPIPRLDAVLKVTGGARYAADMTVANPTYAYLRTSAIARGRIARIDQGEARKVAGLIDIFTHENLGGQVKEVPFFLNGGPASTSIRPLDDDRIWHDGQIVAMAVADTFEAAREAAGKIEISYEAAAASAGFDAPGVEVQAAKDVVKMHEDPSVGDAQAALASADVKIAADYETPTQHHNPIELFATTCAWDGGQLTVFEPSQMVVGLQHGLAKMIGISPTDVRVLSPYVGGAFGSKGSVTPRTAIVALAARRIGRPVKLVATRDQGFTIATYRAETRHHVELGAARDGRLTALVHEGWEVTSRPDAYKVGGTDTTARFYNVPNVATKVSVVHADRNTPGFMRSPPEVPYMFALESAMDELAVALSMDPIELRRINDTMHEPIKGLPYTSRALMPCFDAAAKAFDWSARKPTPASMRDGDWLVGYGCASSCYPTQMAPATARVRLYGDGTVRVETAAHEIGNGAYTVIGQTAGVRLGIDPEKIAVVLGDSSLPPAPVAGGSITTASVCNAVAMACDKINERLGLGSKQTADAGTMGVQEGRLAAAPAAGARLLDALKQTGMGAIEEYAEFVPGGSKPGAIGKLYEGTSQIVGGPKGDKEMMFAFGAEFVEVHVHARTREIRVPRVVGAFAAGHIVNPRTAHSQLMGGLIWGVSSALHEATEIDRKRARYVNDNLADYLMPVNADVQSVEVIMVPERDTEVNPLGIKGLGELGNVGTNAAVANAVFHATGIRVRKLPIRIESLLA